jgi:hypothetical protein
MMRKTVKEVLNPYHLQESASDAQVQDFIHNATTSSLLHRWKHSTASYQGILGTFPGDLIGIMHDATTYEGVFTALREFSGVKGVVQKSKKEMECMRELNELKQGKSTVGRYSAAMNKVPCFFRTFLSLTLSLSE